MERHEKRMTVRELIERLQQPDIDPEWLVDLNPSGENILLAEVQVEPEFQYVGLVSAY